MPTRLFSDVREPIDRERPLSVTIGGSILIAQAAIAAASASVALLTAKGFALPTTASPVMAWVFSHLRFLATSQLLVAGLALFAGVAAMRGSYGASLLARLLIVGSVAAVIVSTVTVGSLEVMAAATLGGAVHKARLAQVGVGTVMAMSWTAPSLVSLWLLSSRTATNWVKGLQRPTSEPPPGGRSPSHPPPG
jgi:hypothetical protein